MRSTLSPRCLSSFLLSALGGLLLASGCGEDPNHDWDPMASQPDELVPPRNWSYLDTTAAPTLLSSKRTPTRAAASNDITLSYRNKTATYSCTITQPASATAVARAASRPRAAARRLPRPQGRLVLRQVRRQDEQQQQLGWAAHHRPHGDDRWRRLRAELFLKGARDGLRRLFVHRLRRHLQR